MLQACLNGGRTRQEAACVPITANELARDAKAVSRAGVACLHVHPRNETGEESLEPGDVGSALIAIREAVPGMPVGIGTGAWISPGGTRRHAHMKAWSVFPDYVSINLNEEDAPDVMKLMDDMGIGIEAGIWSVEDAQRFNSLSDMPQPLRILIEMPDIDGAMAQAQAKQVVEFLVDAGWSAPILLHGIDESAWPCLALAATMGLDTRIGFEDAIHLPDGTLAQSNLSIVEAANTIISKKAHRA